MNAGTFTWPAAVLRVVPIGTNVDLALVCEDTLMLATIGVRAGKPLTTGATAEPAETITCGALATVVDAGASTSTT